MFADYLRSSATRCGARIAAKAEGRVKTYAEVHDASVRLANVLRDAGVAPGDAVATLSANRLEAIEEMGAIALGGFVRSPLYAHDAPERQILMLRVTAARALVVDAGAWEKLEPALSDEDRRRLRTVLVHGGAGDKAYAAALARASSRDPDTLVDPEATHVIRFSAGTTGQPKAVAHTLRAYHDANEAVLSRSPALTEDDIYLAVSPYSHGSGNMVWPFVRVGARHVILKGFDADAALPLIEAERVTTLFLVPTMIQRLLTSPLCAKTDLSSIRRIIYGAAAIPEALISRALDVFGDVLYQCYGQSEVVPITILTPEDHRADPASGRLRSAGRPAIGCAVRIEDETGKVLPAGVVGEIVGKSPGAMQCIVGDPKATAERITSDGWVRTRDIGWLDADGYLFVGDRLDDMIISGGFNIAPAEIEDALAAHPAVVEAVVFGAPDPQWGASPVAVVRLEEGHAASEDELVAWTAGRLGRLKKPARVLFAAEALPINAAGKLLRRAAKDKYWPPA